ncbi:MAG: ABC transporter substrate-binding protein [Clostridia bacterium]|nr:ABC transporter substrate-binding protein [Clostridia bacterium]
MKKILAMLIALMLVLAVPTLAEEASYNVGICQLVQHVALDDATQGFMDALTAKLGDKVTFNLQNASGDSATCVTIMNSLIAEEVDLIMANATPALQAAQAATGDIPILGTSVTDYASALDIADWAGVTGINISGTSDLAPLDGQAALLQELFPEAKEVGLLYCTAEANSVYQVETIEGYLTAAGYNCTMYGFTDSNDVASVVQSACANSDVLYAPTDNTVASCTEAIRNVVDTEKKAIVGGDEGICAGCGVATICINYYDLGYATGEMAYEILVNGADVSAMPVEFSPNPIKVYNPEICEYLGITVPEGYQAIGG